MSKKSFLIFVLLFFIQNALFSQCFIKGSVIDGQSNLPVANASLILKASKMGISANKMGEFQLKTTCIQGEILVVSAINYTTTEVIVDTFKQEIIVTLKLIEKQLSTITLKHQKRTVILNEIKNCSNNYYIGSESMYQIAQLYENPFSYSKISGIELCKLRGNDDFRLRIYDVDSITLKPKNEIADTTIYVNTTKRKSFIDLKKYNIKINKDKFFVSIEWLFTEKNAFLQKSKINGVTTYLKVFEPHLGIKKGSNDKNEDNQKKVWGKYGAKWNLLGSNVEELLMAVFIEKVDL